MPPLKYLDPLDHIHVYQHFILVLEDILRFFNHDLHNLPVSMNI